MIFTDDRRAYGRDSRSRAPSMDWSEHRIRTLLLLCLFLGIGLFFKPHPTQSQDVATTDEPQPVTTEAPTETPAPTDTPPPTPTDLPTATPPPSATPAPTETSVPTLEPTALPTETLPVTDVAPPTVTLPAGMPPTATETGAPLPPEPPLALLWSETFDSGDLSHWRLGAGWALVAHNGGQALQLSQPAGAVQFAQTPLQDVAIQARFLTTMSAAELMVRQSGDGSYSASLNRGGQIVLARSGQPMQTVQITSTMPGQWRTLRLSAVGNLVRVAVDGIDVMAVQDSAPLPAGAVSFAASFPRQTPWTPEAVTVDDVLVSADASEAPPTAMIVPTDAPPPPTATTAPVEARLQPEPTQPFPTLVPPTETVAAPGNGSGRVILVPETVILAATATTMPTMAPTAAATRTPLPTAAATAEPPIVAMALADSTTSAPVLTAPADNVTMTNSRPTLRWNAVSGAERYLVQIARDPSFTALEYLRGGITTTSATVPVTLLHGKHYWRVRSKVSGVWGDFSPTYSFTVLLNTSPADGATTQDTTPTFTWASAPGVSNYRVQVATNPQFTNLVINVAISRLRYTPAAALALPSGVYYWRAVTNLDMNGGAGSIAYRTLTIGSPVSAPSLVSPADAAQLATQQVPLQWQGITAPTGLTLTGYEIQLASDSAFTADLSLVSSPGAVTAYTLNLSVPQATRYWRVRGFFSNASSSPWSAARSFAIDTVAPQAPTLTSPANGSTASSSRPTLNWTAPADASRYELRLGLTNPPTTTYSNLASASYVPPSALPNGIYYWQVRALDTLGNGSAWSGIWSLTVGSAAPAPAAPALSAPADGVILAESRPTLSWSSVNTATAYRLQIARDSGFASVEYTSEWLSDTSLALPVNLLHGLHYWRVQSRANETPSAYSAARSLTIFIGTGPSYSFTSDSTPRFVWQPVVDAAFYRVQVSTNTSFTTIVLNPQIASPKLSFTAGSTGALAPGIYYWRVITDLDANAGVTSIAYRTLVIGAPPAPPTLLTPADQQWLPSQQVSLSWQAVTAPSGLTLTGYEIQLAGDSAFTADVTSLSVNGATTTYNLTGVTQGSHYWRARALFTLDTTSAWSAIRLFGVDTVVPQTPVLNSPAHNATVDTTQPTLTWNADADAARYELRLGTTNPPTTTFDVPSGSSYTPLSPLAVGSYFWQVRAIDKAGNTSAWSVIWRVTVSSNASAAPALNRRATSTVDLRWSPIAWAVAYHVQVDDDRAFGSPTVNNSSVASGSTTLQTPALANGTYYWRARAKRSDGSWGGWSATSTFTVQVGS